MILLQIIRHLLKKRQAVMQWDGAKAKKIVTSSNSSKTNNLRAWPIVR